jgi:hypothetical protein
MKLVAEPGRTVLGREDQFMSRILESLDPTCIFARSMASTSVGFWTTRHDPAAEGVDIVINFIEGTSTSIFYLKCLVGTTYRGHGHSTHYTIPRFDKELCELPGRRSDAHANARLACYADAVHLLWYKSFFIDLFA